MQIHPGRWTAGTYSHHPFRKEHDLNQTSREIWNPAVISFRVYLLQIFISHADSDGNPPSQPPAFELLLRKASFKTWRQRRLRRAGAWGTWKVFGFDDSLLRESRWSRWSRVGGEREPTEKGGGFKLRFLNSLPFFLCSPPPQKKMGEMIQFDEHTSFRWVELKPPTSKDGIDFDCYGTYCFTSWLVRHDEINIPIHLFEWVTYWECVISTCFRFQYEV